MLKQSVYFKDLCPVVLVTIVRVAAINKLPDNANVPVGRSQKETDNRKRPQPILEAPILLLMRKRILQR